MSEIAKTLSSPGRGRGNGDELEPKKVIRRTRNASLHLRMLAEIAPELEADDYNGIRDALAPIVETWNTAYKAPKGGAKMESKR